ncbi:MAG: LptF/LptG family permease [Desulfobulbaceae bacterium]|nr:LptF/LptG family permease [Desulfobulbaceae bacterium]HIJ78670.1 YjgP/YjgQ family permease [Deltaproteobacteria bacterium]
MATEILAPFFASLLIINAILFLGKMIPLLDVIFDFGIGSADFVRLCAYMLPELMLFPIPMASMIAVILAVTRMVNDNEIMALKASGSGLYKLLPPVVAVACCTALFGYFCAVNLAPKGTIASKKLFLHLAKEKIDKGIQERQFSDGIRNVVLYVTKVDPQTKQWQGVYVSDLRHGNMPVTIVAKSGSLISRLEDMQIILNLSDGAMHRAAGDVTQTIRFKNYNLKLPLTPPTHFGKSSLTDVGKNGLHQHELLAEVARYDKNPETALPFLIEYHLRMALPVGGFILTILALPLAITARPGRRPYGLPLGLFFFILYYIMLTAAKSSCDNLQAAAIFIWLPNIIYGGLTLILTWQVARESTQVHVDRAIKFIATAIDKLPRITRRKEDR